MPTLQPEPIAGLPPNNISLDALQSVYVRSNDSAISTIGDTNATLFTYFIQNGTLQSLNTTQNNAVPKNPFPFTNIAVCQQPGASSPEVFLYHQINETSFGEEVWNDDSSSWISTIIKVDTST